MTTAAKPVTGRKVLAIALGAFGVIITANMALVYAAIGSFPGLEVKNTYVASQSFDTDRAEQAALGWTVDASYSPGTLRLAFTDDAGLPFHPADIIASVGRATHANADRDLSFQVVAEGYSAPANLQPGKWELRLSAHDAKGATFRQRLTLMVRE